MQLPFLPLCPTEVYQPKPHLRGTQPREALTPEDRAKRIAKRRRDIELVMRNEPYQWYASHVTNKSEIIPVPRIRVDELGVRSWLGVMRKWKYDLYNYRARHSGEATPSEPGSDASMPDLDSELNSELGDAMDHLSIAPSPPATPPLAPSPPLSWAGVVGGSGGSVNK